MDVVATGTGKYGRMRQRGDAFTLSDREGVKARDQFSKRWMAKAGTPEAKAARADVAGPSVTREQVQAEIAAAAGNTAKAEIAAQAARIAELEAKIEAGTPVVQTKPKVETTAKVETFTDDGDGGDGDGDGGEPKAPRRRRSK